MFILGCVSSSVVLAVVVSISTLLIAVLFIGLRKPLTNLSHEHYLERYKQREIKEISPPLPLGCHPYSKKDNCSKGNNVA